MVKFKKIQGAAFILEQRAINTVAVFAAMDKETDYFLSKIENPQQDGDAVKGKLFGKVFYFVKTGIGSLNGAFSAAKFLSTHKVDLVINIGCVGSHFKSAGYGDMIAVKAFLGQGDFLSDSLDSISTDEGLTEKLIKCFDNGVFVGDIASGDLWRGKDDIPAFAEQYKTLGEDMEGFSIAFCAEKLNLPLVAVKFVSNNELTEKSYLCDFFPDCQATIYKALEKFFA